MILTKYSRIIPLCCSVGGGFQLSKREKAVMSVAVILSGAADGAVVHVI